MFSIFARNARALGLAATHAVPVVNPVPPADISSAMYYANHPPGLPWLVMLADRIVQPVELAGRLIALLASLLSALLLADIATRLSGRDAGFAAGALLLALPAGLHHGLLVNYETVAIPGLLLLVRSLSLGVGRPVVAAVIAAFADWISLLPLVMAWPRTPRRRWFAASLAAATVIVATMLLSRTAEQTSTLGILAQAMGTSFLAPDFSWGAWSDAMGAHLPALYGWALLSALLAVFLIPSRAPPVRRALAWLLVTGLANVVLFGRHAIGHEHFSLLLLPFVALATANLIFPHPQLGVGRVRLGAVVLVVLLATGWLQYREAAPARNLHNQADSADTFRAVTGTDAVYLRPGGASFVFLHRAERHIVPHAFASLNSARSLLSVYRRSFATGATPGRIALSPGEATPTWLAPLGTPVVREGWRFFELPSDL
jgi:hypothetical protein